MMTQIKKIHGATKALLLFLHDIPYLFLHSYLHNSPADFLKLYSIIHSGFFGLSGLGEECQGLGLRYLLKESRYMLFKRQNDRKMCRVFPWFSTFCMSLPYLCPILAQTIKHWINPLISLTNYYRTLL